jgi:hypothetical protein
MSFWTTMRRTGLSTSTSQGREENPCRRRRGRLLVSLCLVIRIRNRALIICRIEEVQQEEISGRTPQDTQLWDTVYQLYKQALDGVSSGWQSAGAIRVSIHQLQPSTTFTNIQLCWNSRLYLALHSTLDVTPDNPPLLLKLIIPR